MEGKNLLLDIPNVKAYDELRPMSRGYAETKVNVIVTQGGTATVAREATKAKARWFPSDATCCLCMFRFVHLMLAVRRFQSAVLLTRVYQGNKETRMKMAFRHNNKNYAGINTDPARTVVPIAQPRTNYVRVKVIPWR